MSKYKKVDVVNVYLWGQHLGAVALQPRTGFYGFAFTEAFKKTGIEPSPLFLRTDSDTEIHQFLELNPQTYHRLPGLLSDSLPDKFGRQLMTSYFQSLGLTGQEITPLDMLAYMGKRGMGALEFQPLLGPRNQKPTAIKIKALREEAQSAVNGSLDPQSVTKDLGHILKVGTSAGGARAKAILAWNRDTDEFVTGQVDCPPGFEHWLFKFDGVTNSALGDPKNYGRIEYAYHLMARAAGIEMSECRLVEENGRAHFMTKRFDRTADNRKHHMQTLCGLAHVDFNLNSGNTYGQLFETIRRLNLPTNDLESAFVRMAFNVFAWNCDDHSKNISFILRQGEAWRLAPAYDLTFHFDPQRPWFDHHCLSVNGKAVDITRRDLLEEALRADIPNAPQLIDQVRDAVGSWERFAKEAGLPQGEAERIQAQLSKN